MTTKILLYLHTDHSELGSWLTMDLTGKILETKTRTPLTELKNLPKNTRLDVIIPGEEVLVTSVELPKMSRQKLREVLPFALEEKLISDVNDLHFAISEDVTDEATPVIVVKKQKMDAWLKTLNEIGLTPQTLIPSIFAIPDNWHICIDDKIAIVRTEKYRGFACDFHNLTTFLSLELTRKDLTKPECIYLHRFQESELNLTLDSIAVLDIPSDKNLLTCMHTWLQEYPYINLLQGKYANKESVTLLKNPWMIVSVLAFSWLLLLFAGHLTSYFMLKKAVTHSELEIEKIYKNNFPNATSVVAPRERMESKLKTLSGNAQNNVVLSLLSDIGKSLEKAPAIQIQSVDFRDNRLTLTVFSKTFEDLDIFNQSLITDGLQVKQQNAGMSGSFVKANLIIHKGVL